jgi:hypothetical protein
MHLPADLAMAGVWLVACMFAVWLRLAVADSLASFAMMQVA